jgi:hypothetical protein
MAGCVYTCAAASGRVRELDDAGHQEKKKRAAQAGLGTYGVQQTDATCTWHSIICLGRLGPQQNPQGSAIVLSNRFYK